MQEELSKNEKRRKILDFIFLWIDDEETDKDFESIKEAYHLWKKAQVSCKAKINFLYEMYQNCEIPMKESEEFELQIETMKRCNNQFYDLIKIIANKK